MVRKTSGQCEAPPQCVVKEQRYKSTVFLTVSAGALSRGLPPPPGVKVGLKDMERFLAVDAAEGTSNF